MNLMRSLILPVSQSSIKMDNSTKEKLRHSRVDLTQQIVKLINQSEHPPFLISGSATGIYGDGGEDVLTENSYPSSQFTAQLCINWENAAKQANTRVCLVRTGLVLSPKAALLQNPSALSLRIRRQIREWRAILELDRIRRYGKGLLFLLDHNDCKGAFNFTAPHPVKNKTFNQLLGQALHRPCFAQSTSILLTSLFSVNALCIILDSQNAYPKHFVRLRIYIPILRIKGLLSQNTLKQRLVKTSLYYIH